MITAVCPGSFDPVTYGHLDIIRRAASMFDRVIVLVVTNLAKQPMFTKEERMDFLRRATSGLDNVEVDSYGGLLADYTREHDARVIVKGLRAMSDGTDQPPAEPGGGNGVFDDHRRKYVFVIQPGQTGGGTRRRNPRFRTGLHRGGYPAENRERRPGKGISCPGCKCGGLQRKGRVNNDGRRTARTD